MQCVYAREHGRVVPIGCHCPDCRQVLEWPPRIAMRLESDTVEELVDKLIRSATQ